MTKIVTIDFGRAGFRQLALATSTSDGRPVIMPVDPLHHDHCLTLTNALGIDRGLGVVERVARQHLGLPTHGPVWVWKSDPQLSTSLFRYEQTDDFDELVRWREDPEFVAAVDRLERAPRY